MKKLLLAVIAIAMVAPAIAKTKKKKKHIVNSAITSVQMHRTACYGRCPDYTIELNKDGMATYTGIRFVDDSGIYKKDIGTTKTMAIINQLIAYRVDTCQKNYPNRIPDVPGIIYVINYKDSTKTIFNANWGPQFLKDVATDMDNVGKKTDKTWKKVKK